MLDSNEISELNWKKEKNLKESQPIKNQPYEKENEQDPEEKKVDEKKENDMLSNKTEIKENIQKEHQKRSHDPREWTFEQTADWVVEEVKLDPKYRAVFVENEVNGVALLKLQENDLIELGVKAIGSKRTLKDAIDSLKKKVISLST